MSNEAAERLRLRIRFLFDEAENLSHEDVAYIEESLQAALAHERSAGAAPLDVELLENVIRETRRFADRPGEWAAASAREYARLLDAASPGEDE